MVGSEAERQFYLGMAGVRLWYARDALPGAAPSPEYDVAEGLTPTPEAAEAVVIPGEPSVPEKTGVNRTERHAGTARIASLQSLMQDSTAPATEPPAVAVPDSVEGGGVGADDAEQAVASAHEPAVRLNIQVWLGGRIGLISTLSSEASLRLQETLAENILRSLGDRDCQSIGPIRWPVFNNFRAPGNSMADLLSVMNYVLSGLEDQKLIVLGLSDGGGQDVSGLLGQLAGAPPALSFPRSLAELAADPALKRSLWQELKPLAAR